MKQALEKIDILEYVTKHTECKEWLSEIETWQSGIQFMKDLILKFSTKLEDENRILEVRIFHNELDEKLTRRLEWLVEKIEIQSSYIKFYFKKNHLKDPTELRIQHKMLAGEVAQLREKYLEIRNYFFEIIKPVLKKRRSQRRSSKAA